MDSYLITKTIHIFCVLAWVSGLFMNAVVLTVFKRAPQRFDQATLVFFHKLDQRIANSAQGLAWLFGVGLIFMGGWFPDGWLIAKLICVVFISVLHGVQSAALRKASKGQGVERRLALTQRLAIIAPVIVLFVVYLVVNKPI